MQALGGWQPENKCWWRLMPVFPQRDHRSEREAAFYQAVWSQPTPLVFHPGEGLDSVPQVVPEWGVGPHFGPRQGSGRPQDLEALREFIPKYCGWRASAQHVMLIVSPSNARKMDLGICCRWTRISGGPELPCYQECVQPVQAAMRAGLESE